MDGVSPEHFAVSETRIRKGPHERAGKRYPRFRVPEEAEGRLEGHGKVAQLPAPFERRRFASLPHEHGPKLALYENAYSANASRQNAD